MTVFRAKFTFMNLLLFAMVVLGCTFVRTKKNKNEGKGEKRATFFTRFRDAKNTMIS